MKRIVLLPLILLAGCAIFRENPNLVRAYLATIPGDVEAILVAVEVFSEDTDTEKFQDAFAILWPIVNSKVNFLVAYYGAQPPPELAEIQVAVAEAKAKADAIIAAP